MRTFEFDVLPKSDVLRKPFQTFFFALALTRLAVFIVELFRFQLWVVGCQ